MSSGFNTDIPHGEHTLHVQTEDRGPQHLVIDTVVYRNGHILHRRSAEYADFAGSAEFSAEALRQRVEAQHREVIEALRAGSLDSQIAVAEQEAVRAAGIQLQLLNAGSWLAAGRVSLDISVVRRGDGQPAAGARIDATIEGALRENRQSAVSDESGRAKIEFELPPLGKGDLALVIEAELDSKKENIRFAMRSRSKTQPSAAT
jgi:hypothetical protein